MKNTSNRHAGGFTLLEILVVMAIIIVLAGLVFRLSGVVSEKNSVAKTRERLERLASAIEEFRAIYGKYPPVPNYPTGGGSDESQPVRYEFACINPKYSGMPLTEGDAAAMKSAGVEWQPGREGFDRLYTFGLLSFIFPRYIGHAEEGPTFFVGGSYGGAYNPNLTIDQWSKYNSRKQGGTIGDMPKDVEGSRRMLAHMGISLDDRGAVAQSNYGMVHVDMVARVWQSGGKTYDNRYLTVEDDWYHELRYESFPPYDTYRLWSVGRDGKSGTLDDIVAGLE